MSDVGRLSNRKPHQFAVCNGGWETSPIRPQRRTPTSPTLPIGASNNLNVGRRPNLGSDTGLFSHPQRRTEDFTHPSAKAKVYFLQRPDRPILSRIFELSFRVSAVGTLSASEALLLLHAQRRSTNLFLFQLAARSLSQISNFPRRRRSDRSSNSLRRRRSGKSWIRSRIAPPPATIGG